MARRRHQRGLTLVEVLLVVVITGVLGAVVVLTVPPRASDAEAAARAFAGEVPGLSDAAVTGARMVGLSVAAGPVLTTHAYQGGAWREAGRLPVAEGVAVTLTPAGEVLPPDEPTGKTLLVYRPPGAEPSEPAPPPPPVTFGATGEATPFDALFADGKERWGVRVTGDGRAEVRREG